VLQAPEASVSSSAEWAERVIYSCFSQGVSFEIAAGNILTLTPAPTISKVAMDRALTFLESAIAEVEAAQ
jgi:4-aminobutyrate aminotransferase